MMVRAPQPRPRIKVLIVDDSMIFRRFLLRTFQADPSLEVIAEAASAEEAAEIMATVRPDVITLDLEMPGRGGMRLLRETIAPRRIPTIVISSQTIRGARRTIEALEAGAVDVLAKPQGLQPGTPDRIALENIATRVKIVSRLNLHERVETLKPVIRTIPARATRDWLLAIGGSTGGVQAFGTLLQSLPAECPPVVIVQHMPEGFTHAFAQRLDNQCAIKVREAAQGDLLQHGCAYIAPGGDRHMQIVRNCNLQLEVNLIDGDPVCFSKPSVDVLFQSVARVAGARASGAILTGMGSDGARGLLAMRRAGAKTFAQDESTSLIYGMPARAWEMGGATAQVPLERMAETLLTSVGTTSAMPELSVSQAAKNHSKGSVI